MSAASQRAARAYERAWQLLSEGAVREAAGVLTGALRTPRLSRADEADLRHLLGRCYDELGDEDAMVGEWLTVRRLDRELDAPQPRLSPEEFEERVDAALRELPGDLRDRLGAVAIVVDERPGEAMVRDGIDPRILGLYSGVPYGQRSFFGGGAFPEVIYLFARNLEAEAADDRQLEHQIRITVVHETAHYFGLSDQELAALGLG